MHAHGKVYSIQRYVITIRRKVYFFILCIALFATFTIDHIGIEVTTDIYICRLVQSGGELVKNEK